MDSVFLLLKLKHSIKMKNNLTVNVLSDKTIGKSKKIQHQNSILHEKVVISLSIMKM